MHPREDDLLLDRDLRAGEDRGGRRRVAGLPVEAVVVGLARRRRRGSAACRGRARGVRRRPAGSTSYSTSISSSASRAAYRSSATTKATSWPWKRTLSVASTAWTSPERVGIQARPRSASIAPVTTALDLRVRLGGEGVDADTIRAWATGERRIARWSMPGQLEVVAVKRPLPRTNRRSSLRSIRPCPRSPRARARSRRLMTARLRRSVGCSAAQLDRPDDGGVAGAAADLAGDGLADRPARSGAGSRSSSARAVMQHPRRAEAALEPVALHEPLLDRVEHAVDARGPRRSGRRGRRPSRPAPCTT